MAISFVAASNNQDARPSSTITLTKPTGTAENDLIIALIWVYLNNAPTAPSGWALIPNSPQTEGGANTYQFVYYKIAGASEPATYQWTWGSTYYVMGGIAAYRGVDRGNPFDANSSLSDPSNVTSHPFTSLTVGGSNRWAIAFLTMQGYQGSITVPSGFSNREDTFGSDPQCICDSNGTISSGSYAPGNWTSPVSGRAVSYLLILRPATVVYRSSNSATASSVNNIVCNKPSGVVDGDLMIACLVFYRDNSVPGATPSTVPAGWTEIASSPQHGYWGTIYGVIVHCYWKIASSEGASYEWILDATSGNISVAISAYSGTHSSTPIDVSNGSGRDTELNTSITPPAVTLSEMEMVVTCFGIPGYRTVTKASDMVERQNISGTVVWIGDTNGVVASGTFTPASATSNSNSAFGAFTLGLKPAADGPIIPIFEHNYRAQRAI